MLNKVIKFVKTLLYWYYDNSIRLKI